MSLNSTSSYQELEALEERQAMLKEQITADISAVQSSIHDLTVEMIEDIKEYTRLEIHSCNDVFQDILTQQKAINDLQESHRVMQQLFASFSSHLSTALADDEPDEDERKSQTAPAAISSPASSTKSFSTPLAFSMAHEFEREGKDKTN
jgi:hypothetical protein